MTSDVQTPPSSSMDRSRAPIASPATSAVVIAGQMIAERRRSLLWYSVGMVALVALMVAVYPSIRDTGAELDAYAQSLPSGLRDAFGLAADSIASPAGYLMSQLYSNLYPIVLLVFGIALGTWAVAGSEDEGTLELMLANPVTRTTLAIARVVAMWLMVALVAVVSTAVLAAVSPAVQLDEGLPWWGVWSAGLASFALAMLYSSVAFAVGAATGRRGWAIASASVLVVIGFAAQMVGSAAQSLQWLRDASPWYWLIDAAPLSNLPGLWDTWVPLGAAVLLTAAGIVWLNHRDLKA